MVAADMAIHAEESRASVGSVHMGWICAKAWKKSKELYGRLRPFLRVGVSELPEGIEKVITEVIKWMMNKDKATNYIEDREHNND